jgi:hypothetical protein
VLIPRRGSRAFSGTAVLATVAICLVVFVGIWTVQRVQAKVSAARNGARSPSITRAVVDAMSRELRMASYDPGNALPVSTGPCAPGVKQGITEATRTKIRFRQDLNGDGVIAPSGGEDVTYELVGDTIRRSDGVHAPAVLASGIAVNGLTFRYFDGGDPPAEIVPTGATAALTGCQRDRIARVRIDVLAHVTNPDPRGSTPIASLAESEVALRNRSLANF